MSKINKAFSRVILAVISLALMLGIVGCQKNATQETSNQNQPVPTDQSQDPAAAANLAPTADTTQASGTSDQQQQPAQDQNYSDNDYDSRIRATASRYLRPTTRRHRCRNIRSLIAPAMATCGRLDIGATLPKVTTGCPAPGPGRQRWVSCGRRDTGDLSVGDTAITMDSGAAILDITAALITDLATSVWATRAGTGTEIDSTITAR